MGDGTARMRMQALVTMLTPLVDKDPEQEIGSFADTASARPHAARPNSTQQTPAGHSERDY